MPSTLPHPGTTEPTTGWHKTSRGDGYILAGLWGEHLRQVIQQSQRACMSIKSWKRTLGDSAVAELPFASTSAS